jgi:hypothetical protein
VNEFAAVSVDGEDIVGWDVAAMMVWKRPIRH